jgi:thioredoxin 1
MKLFILAFCSLVTAVVSAQSPTLLSANDFAKLMFETKSAVVVDVRTPDEFSKGHLKDARNINWNDEAFTSRVATIDKTTPLFVYCLGGGRSANAAAKLRTMGYAQVYELDGGIMAWRKAGLMEEDAAPRGMTMEQYYAQMQGDKIVLVDFYAEWCGPCKLMKPYLDEIAKDQKDKVTVLRIDVDQNPILATQLQIQALPTMIVYKAGKVSWWNVGYVPKKTVVKHLK